MGRVRWSATRAIEWLDAVAETWLGWALPPATSAVAKSGWAPDHPASYCGRCGTSVGAGERTGGGCAACRDSRGIGAGVVRLGPYEPPLSDWILALKYGGWVEIGELLGSRLADAIAARGGFARATVVSVPSPLVRRLARGGDHAGTLAAAVARRLKVPRKVVLAARPGPRQAGLGAAERRLRGGRGLVPAWRQRGRRRPLDGQSVILVDDVLTTGATARRAVRRLRSMGADRVLVAVLAVADGRAPPEPDRDPRGGLLPP